LRFAVLPAGEDPDSLVRGQGAAALRAVLEAARPLWELLWLVETEGRRFQTPERQAGLVSALDQRIRGIPDATVQAAYREALGRRFETAFGYGAWGRTVGSGPFGGSRGAGSRGGRYGRARRWGRQRGGFRGAGRAGAAAETAVSDGLGARQAPDLLLRRQAQVLLAALVNHPELIAENAEELAGFTLFQWNLGNFSGLLVDLVAREPDLDTAGLKCHLSDQGYSGILGEILGPAVYVHGGFARPEGSLDEARNGVQDILKVYRRRLATSETEEAGRHLAEDMSEDRLARLEAKRRLIRESESGPDSLDHLD
jgi:DNA primase